MVLVSLLVVFRFNRPSRGVLLETHDVGQYTYLFCIVSCCY